MELVVLFNILVVDQHRRRSRALAFAGISVINITENSGKASASDSRFLFLVLNVL